VEIQVLDRIRNLRGGERRRCPLAVRNIWTPFRRVVAIGGTSGFVAALALVWVLQQALGAPTVGQPVAVQTSPIPQQRRQAEVGTQRLAQSPAPRSTGNDVAAAIPLSPVREQALRPRDTFSECANCPKMVVVPAGNFMMGSPANETGRYPNEGPQHAVTILKAFAVSETELTFEEWDACVAEGGCGGYGPPDAGWGRGRRPVINVSWNDARSYVAWLSMKTGKTYRLLSEAEYEFATRAGTQTEYQWGSAIGRNHASCNDCGSDWDAYITAPVGSFAANAFGLYDMVGNVSVWTEDCYHDSYDAAPADGSAWTAGDCSRRVVRGASWFNPPARLRSAARDWSPTDIWVYVLGLRVARTLLAP
jgi:formylglycine-generating enzyme required for sulfatase activity